jgi:hypothetical protein
MNRLSNLPPGVTDRMIEDAQEDDELDAPQAYVRRTDWPLIVSLLLSIGATGVIIWFGFHTLL